MQEDGSKEARPFRNYVNVAKNGQRYENYLLWWQQGRPPTSLYML